MKMFGMALSQEYIKQIEKVAERLDMSVDDVVKIAYHLGVDLLIQKYGSRKYDFVCEQFDDGKPFFCFPSGCDWCFPD